MTLLRCITGSESWTNHMAKAHVFHYSPEWRETHIGVAARDPARPGISRVRVQTIKARPDATSIDLGSWADTVYEVEENSYFKIFANRSGAFGSAKRCASQIIRCRSNAALRVVRIPLSTHAQAALSYAVVEGRFDLLDFEEAKVLNLPVLDQFKTSMDPVMVARVMEFSELEPEVIAKPQFDVEKVMIDGKEENILIRRRGRIMNL